MIRSSITGKIVAAGLGLLLLYAVLPVNTAHAEKVIKQAANADTVLQTSNLVKGNSLPDFTLQTPDASTISLSSLRGDVILIDFWASWCMPCRASIPHLKELYQKYHNKGFAILSVSIDQNNKAWKTAMLKEAMPWQQVIDKYEEGKDASVMMNALGFQSVPFTIILNKNGKVELINPTATEIDNELKKVFNQ